MSQPLLEGEVEYVDVDSTRSDTHAERIAELEEQVAALHQKLATVKRDAVVILLQMFSDSLRHIASGKMDIPDTPVVGSGSDRWEQIKRGMPPRLQECIGILQLQGSMKRTQIAAALRMDYSNCTKNVIGVLLRQGWLIENGGQLSLKQL